MDSSDFSTADILLNLSTFLVSKAMSGDGLSGEQIATIQDQYNAQRDTVRRKNSDLGFDGDYHQPVVKGTDEFDRFDVATLRTKVDQINLDTVAALISAWNEISSRNTTSLDDFRKQIARGTSPDVWSGAAASAAAATVSGYDETGKKVSTAAALTGNKLDELRTGLEPTKRLVPYTPEHRSGLDNLGSFVTGRGWRNDDVAQANAKAEAVRVLNTVYAPVVHESDEKVPVIPIPKTIDNGSPGTTPNPGSGTPNTTTPAATTPGTTPSTNPTTPASTTENPGTGDTTTTTDDSTGTTTAGDNSTTPESTTPQSTTPAATTPSSPGTGSPAGTPSGTGTPGTGSPGSGTPGAGIPSTGSPGRSIAGGNPPANSAAASRATGTGAGAAGRSGMPGMMSPGAKGGGKDDESTKGIPDYLITQEHGDELTGLDHPSRTVPPVIGAD